MCDKLLYTMNFFFLKECIVHLHNYTLYTAFNIRTKQQGCNYSVGPWQHSEPFTSF